MIDWERVDDIARRNRRRRFRRSGRHVSGGSRRGDRAADGQRGPDPTLEAELHFLKGSALNLGFADLAALCQDGEKRRGIGRSSVDLDAVLRLLRPDAQPVRARPAATAARRDASDQEFGQRLVLGDVAIGETRGVHAAGKAGRKFSPPSVSIPISTEPKLRADFFRYSNRAMSSSGPSIDQEFAQRTGALRHAQDEVFLQPGIALGAFLHLGQAFESRSCRPR